MVHTFHNHSLKYLNSFGLGATARSFHVFQNIEDLVHTSVDLTQGLTLGGGSNLLFVNSYQASVLKIDLKGINTLVEDDKSISIRVGAGEIWHDLVLWAIDNGYGGIENLSLIPGTTGAAPIQNIGAYGVELSDVFLGLEAIDKESRTIKNYSREDCKFGYRNSIFKNELKNKTIITSVDLKLSKTDHIKNTDYGAIQEELEKNGALTNPSISNISQAVINIRTRKLYDPSKVGNCGSFFKNPILTKVEIEKLLSEFPETKYYPNDEDSYKIPAGWLIESLGWKGRNEGGAAVSHKHALVLINQGNAKGSEVYKLSTDIINSVIEKYGITLEREVNMIV